MVDPRRILQLNNFEQEFEGPVVYWMSRDQRVQGNWALLYAQEIAEKNKAPLLVVFCLNPSFLGATLRQYDFMIGGLKEVEKNLHEKNISFTILEGNPEDKLPAFIKKHGIAALITDFSPLRISRKWKKSVSKEIKIPFYEVDAHNIVPCFLASNKQEFAAKTIRPKITKLLDEFLVPYPNLKKSSFEMNKFPKIEWDSLFKKLSVDKEVKPVDWIQPGYTHAKQFLNKFIKHKLQEYDELRNNPNFDSISNMSPFLHYGHISSQEIALEIIDQTNRKIYESYLEELIIRKELSDNYCYFNENYDNYNGFPAWAQKSLNEHRNDERDYIYSRHEFETAKTHDKLWNAAQLQMVNTGKMHGFMRMYWAKKILEWSESPEKAQEIAIYLNDKFELDGRDPSGYTGIAWSIGGVHDRAWFTRKVFGKIRYMNDRGCERKFDVNEYIKTQCAV